MVYIKDSINQLEKLSLKKLTYDIIAYKRYVKEHNDKIDGAHISAFEYFDELLRKLIELEEIRELIIDKANNIITLENFRNKELIIKRKTDHFESVLSFEKLVASAIESYPDSFLHRLIKLADLINIKDTKRVFSQDGIFNKILMNDFTDINLGDFLKYIFFSFHIIIKKLYYYENDIKFYIKDSEDYNVRREMLHEFDYQKEIYLFFNVQLN